MNVEENEVAKHIKKKESNTSKSCKKSKHKHVYKDCVFYPDNLGLENASIGTYCSICGKIGSVKHPTIKSDIGYRVLTADEVLKEYEGLPVFELQDWFQKYVCISRE